MTPTDRIYLGLAALSLALICVPGEADMANEERTTLDAYIAERTAGHEAVYVSLDSGDCR